MVVLSDPNDDDIARLAKQWLFVQEVVEERYGMVLDQSLGDLELIQRILDDQIFSTDDDWELESLGIVLGRVLADNAEGLDWAVVDDEYGRDLTLRFLDTSLTLNVGSMILRRIEDGDDVDVKLLYEQLLSRFDELKHEAR